MMTLNILFKRARLEAGLTQEQVANRIGLTASAYGKIESGLRGVGVDHIRPLCDVLGVTYADALDAICPLFCGAAEEDGTKRHWLDFGTGEKSPGPFGLVVRDRWSREFTKDELSFLDVLARFTGLDRMDDRLQRVCDEAIFLRRRAVVFGTGSRR